MTLDVGVKKQNKIGGGGCQSWGGSTERPFLRPRPAPRNCGKNHQLFFRRDITNYCDQEGGRENSTLWGRHDKTTSCVISKKKKKVHHVVARRKEEIEEDDGVCPRQVSHVGDVVDK